MITTMDEHITRYNRKCDIAKAIKATRAAFIEAHPILMEYIDLHKIRMVVEETNDIDYFNVTLYVKGNHAVNAVRQIKYGEIDTVEDMLNFRFKLADDFFKKNATEAQRQAFLYDE
ncbi:UNVERIFIED_CONTAM: hypothetical protein RF648_21525, partial [Kocuria sp. CPCC 205274]